MYKFWSFYILFLHSKDTILRIILKIIMIKSGRETIFNIYEN